MIAVPQTTLPEPRQVTVTRYVTPLREGGSLPAIVEGDDLGTYVLKFRGAGQGPRVLIAELVAGEIAHALGLPVPELVFADLDPVLGRSEPDQEIQELINASAGLNLGMDYLPGSFAYDPVSAPAIDPFLASCVVWFDALITNVDRTVRNTNMLLWHRSLYLIDNGAAFYAQYSGPNYPSRAKSRFPQIKDHVLLGRAGQLAAADETLAPRLTPEMIHHIVGLVPESWMNDGAFDGPAQQRVALEEYVLRRLESPRSFVEEAVNARAQFV